MKFVLSIFLFFVQGSPALASDREAPNGKECSASYQALVRDHLIKARQIPLTHRNVIGFHGASQQTINQLLATGHVPGGYRAQGIYAYPTRKKINGRPMFPATIPEPGSLDYAHSFAVIHAVMEHLKIENSSSHYLALLGAFQSYLDSQPFERSDLRVLGFSEKELRAAFEKNAHYRGYLLGISRDAAPSIKPHYISDPFIADEIILPNTSAAGVEYRNFISIVPRGPEEERFMNELAKPKPAQ